jgi:hypothetical protein
MRIRSVVLILLGLLTLCFQPVAADPPGTTVRHVDYANRTITLELYRRVEGTKQVTIYKIDMGCTFTLDGVTIKFKQVHRGLHVIGMTMGEPSVIDSLSLQSSY